MPIERAYSSSYLMAIVTFALPLIIYDTFSVETCTTSTFIFQNEPKSNVKRKYTNRSGIIAFI